MGKSHCYRFLADRDPYYNIDGFDMRSISSLLLFASVYLWKPARAFCEPPALAQLRMAAGAASDSVGSPTNEGAASANELWAENGGEAVPVSAPEISGRSSGQASAPPAARPNLAATLPAVEPVKDPTPDPLPPAKPKGWQGFYLGFLGVEGKALSMLSATGKAAIPLLILAQPIALPVALVAGLLGIFGIRL